MGATIGTQVNTVLARAFQTIVTGGWANESDGDVEAPTGHFALITIEPRERNELADAFSDAGIPIPYPGAYVLVEDSDGNASVTEYLSNYGAKAAYRELVHRFSEWNDDSEVDILPGDRPQAISELDAVEDEKQYLVHACGESFDDFTIAAAHHYSCTEYPSDSDVASWRILPESEAM